jgi:hypothetical protein
MQLVIYMSTLFLRPFVVCNAIGESESVWLLAAEKDKVTNALYCIECFPWIKLTPRNEKKRDIMPAKCT